MAQIISVDDEMTPPKWENLTQAGINTLSSCVDCYQNYVVSGSNNSPDEVVVATTISKETIARLLSESEGDAIRIYLIKESQTTNPNDATFLIVPAKKTTTGSNTYEDVISDESGTVLKMDSCPSVACPETKKKTYLLNK